MIAGSLHFIMNTSEHVYGVGSLYSELIAEDVWGQAHAHNEVQGWGPEEAEGLGPCTGTSIEWWSNGNHFEISSRWLPRWPTKCLS